MSKRIFISTAIPYVNGDPHIGHSLEYVQTDVLARYHRLQVGKENVFSLTGTDENALKNVLAAEQAGIKTIEYIDQKTAEFEKLSKTLNLSFDDFIRTTEKRHIEGVQKLWRAFKKEDIYQDTYEGMYCVGCEEFKTDKDLVDGMCPEHKKKPELVKEKNYFFKLSNYQGIIEKLITEDTIKIVPEKRKNEVLGFLREGLKDFSISRSRARARDWGVRVPNDETQVMYVWVDALSNYITALDYAHGGEKYQSFWNNNEVERIHVIGKGIVKFHALYWIGMLLSAGVPLPTQEFVHGYVTVEGNKIGKSLGNAIHPNEVVAKYGVDAFRYYLLREIPAYGDGDFSWTRMQEVYSSDLVNGLGNLVSRVATMASTTNGYQYVDQRSRSEELTGLKLDVDIAMERYQFDEAIKLIWGSVSGVDSYLSKERPWKLDLADENQKLSKYVILTTAIDNIKDIGEALAPFLPETSARILNVFDSDNIQKPEPLFPKLG